MLHQVIFHLRTPLALTDPLHLDALLMAVHPQAKGVVDVNRDLTDSALVQLPLPLARVECGAQWLWCASSIDLDNDAKPFSGRYKKAISLDDGFYIRKNVMTIGGLHKDRISRIAGYVSKTASFLAASDDPAALAELCGQIKNLGKLRGMGYGQVVGVEIRPTKGGWRDALVRDGRALRNLPTCFVEEEATERIIVQPPYWGMYRREAGVSPGKPATLKKDVQLC